MEIYVWPDYSWCEKDEYCEIADSWRSDDFKLVTIPDSHLDDVDGYITNYVVV